MGDFRTFRTAQRIPAQPLQPVIDPADWSATDLGPVDGWSYRLTERDIDELAAGVAAIRRGGVPLVDVNCETFPLRHFARVLHDVYRELTDGRGMVMLRGFPTGRFDREWWAIANIGLGSYKGKKN